MPCWCRGACPHIAEPRQAIAEGRARQGEMLLRRNLSEAPFCVEGNLLMTDIMDGSNRSYFAEPHLARARKTEGLTPRVRLATAGNLRRQARPAESAAVFLDAVAADEANPQAWAGLIGALEAEGDLDGAQTMVEAAQKKFPELPPVIAQQAALVALADGDAMDAIAFLEGDAIAPYARLLRGRAKEALGDFAGAWADWSGAKLELAEKSGHVYWREHFQQLFSGLYEISQPGRYKLLGEVEGVRHPGPLFVTGFPRSGTTMLETALAAHSAIADGDELLGISDVVHALPGFLRSPLPYPQCLMATTLGDNAEALKVMRDTYLYKSWGKIGWDRLGGRDIFTDKMPLNEIYLPLIRLLFPGAPFVYIRRHPLDIFVSCMSHMLAHGGHFAESLETLAEHYAGADALAQHYKSVMPANVLEVKYESLVADFGGELGKVLGAMGLEMEPACIEFHKSKRQSHTLSYRQIKKPLYSSSVARFKNYLPWLEPALPWIEPILKREGYDL